MFDLLDRLFGRKAVVPVWTGPVKYDALERIVGCPNGSAVTVGRSALGPVLAFDRGDVAELVLSDARALLAEARTMKSYGKRQIDAHDGGTVTLEYFDLGAWQDGAPACCAIQAYAKVADRDPEPGLLIGRNGSPRVLLHDVLCGPLARFTDALERAITYSTTEGI